METHFEGSRGSEPMTNPHQRQYDEQNPDNADHMQSDNHDNPEKDGDLASQVVDHPEDVDSPVNTNYGDNSDSLESLTPDEDADTDPNKTDKPSFNRNKNL